MKHIIIFLLCILSFSFITIAQSGSLDNSFGGDGIVVSELFTGTCNTVVVQNDGKILTGGYHDSFNENERGFIIVRFNPDGSLDESFGENGQRTITNAEGNEVSSLVTLSIQDDEKIIAFGQVIGNTSNHYSDICIVRLNTNGTIDSSFSSNGILTMSIGKSDAVADAVIQEDGKIVVAGSKGITANNESQPFVMRILTNGELDESFGEKGLVLVSEDLDTYNVTAIALQADNKILIAGKYFGNSFYVMRFLPDGRFDNTFDEEKDGVTGIKFEDVDLPNASLLDMTVQPDGKILVAGTGGSTSVNMALVRFKSDGSIDSAFGDKIGYTLLTKETKGSSAAKTVNVETDKKIVLTGFYNVEETEGFAAVKYNADGSIDASFGDNGVAVANFSDLNILNLGVGALQKNGKIIVGGEGRTVDDNIFSRIALVRFNNEITPAPSEFAKIKKWQDHYGFTWSDWPGNKTTYYSVGRSTNASTFSEIAQVTDIVGQKKYQFEDPAPPAGIVYYQLTAIRSDGKTVSSNIISAGTAVAAIKLFPNPAKNSLRIEGLHATNKTKLTIVDVSGNIKVAATATGSNYTLNIAQLKPGNYMLRMETNGIVVTRMFVKE